MPWIIIQALESHTQLDEVANGSLFAMSDIWPRALKSGVAPMDTYHDEEAHADSLADFDKFTLIGYAESQYVEERDAWRSTYAWCSGARIESPPGQSPWGYRQALGKSQTY